MQRALAIVDGEHYADVVREALSELPYTFVAAHLVGGTEKLRGDEDYGVPLVDDLEQALSDHRPDLVLDLSDDPVLDPVRRLRLAARALVFGVPYVGSDFRFDPPVFEPFELPSLAVVGTGKRVGKTAVTGFVARRASVDRQVVVVAMGRGGPAEPEVVIERPTPETLLALSRSGRHAASDHLETAFAVGVPTVGCRRCGGGLAGAVAISNVGDGARAAVALDPDPDLVIFDGSGAALPPIETDARLLVAGAHQPAAVLGGYLTPYRALLADLVLLTMAEGASGWHNARELLRDLVRPGVAVVPVVLRPTPSESVAGELIAFFGTSEAAIPAIRAHLTERHGATVAHVSDALADRGRLRAELEGIDVDTFVVELKAAAVDMVAEEAKRRGIRLVVAWNDVVEVETGTLDPALDRLLERAQRGQVVVR
jgi:cyclic 2,3-diphosphoglycerate synthase